LTAKLEDLRGNRRRTEQLLHDARVDRAYRDTQLIKLADERDQLERELIAAIPASKRWQELDRLGPTDLIAALPPTTAFIEVIRYTRSEYIDKKWQRSPCYVAFVPAKGRAIQRIDFDEPANRSDAAVEPWRTATKQPA